MNIYHIRYNTDTHEMLASVVAENETQARELVMDKSRFEAIVEIWSEPIAAPHLVSDSGWRKGVIK